MTPIEAEIKDFIVGNFMFGQNGHTLTNDLSFLENGIIDSTGVLELIGFLEQRFGIAVADSEIVPANLDSVNNVVQFLARKTAGAGERLAG